MGNPRFPSISLNPLYKPTVLTTSATLTLDQRRVAANNSGGAAVFTLPAAPPDGVVFEVTQVADILQRVTITAGGADHIIDGVTASIILSGFGSKALLCYHAALARWEVLNLQRQSYVFRWDSAAVGDYLQRGSVAVVVLGTFPVLYTGGALASANPLQIISGTIVVSNLFLQSRSNVGANTGVKVRTATSTFGTAADLASPLAATIASGAQSAQVSARTVLTVGPDTSSKSWLILQATTAINTAVDGVLEFYTL